MSLWMVSVIALAIFLLLTDPGRQLLAFLTTETSKRIAGYVVLCIRYVFKSHFLILKNLALPREVIFPSLRKDNQVNMRK